MKKILLVTSKWGDEDHPIYEFSEHAHIFAHGPDAAVLDLSHSMRSDLVNRRNVFNCDDEVEDFLLHKQSYDVIIVDSKCSHEFWVVAILYNPKLILINVSYCPELIPRGTLRDPRGVSRQHRSEIITYNQDNKDDSLGIFLGFPVKEEQEKRAVCTLPGTH